MFFDEMLQGNTVTESLSNLCTMLVVMDPSEGLLPVDHVLGSMKTSLQSGVAIGDGDVVVLCMRATGILLERALRQLKRSHAIVLPFLKELFNAALPAEDCSSPMQREGSSPTVKRRRSGSGGGRTSTVAAQPLVFSTSRPHELGEEVLRCLPLLQQVPTFAAAVPVPTRVAKMCLELSRSTAPTPVIELALHYVSSLVRSSTEDIYSTLVVDAGTRGVEVIHALAATCDFSPQWDCLLCAATQLLLVVKSRQTTKDVLRTFTDAYMQLCAQSVAKRPVPQRLSLIVGCAATVAAGCGITAHDIATQWDLWMQQVLDLGAGNASASASLKIGNPFSSAEGGHAARGDDDASDDDDDASDEDEMDEDEDEGRLGTPLPNRYWVAEDAKLSVLFLVAHGLFGCSSDKMRWRYTAAWRDDDETFRRYPFSVGKTVVEAYLTTTKAEAPLPHLSPYHSVQLNALLQSNTRTSMLRPVFLQPIPTLGCKPQKELQFPSGSAGNTSEFNFESWLRVLQPYCAGGSTGSHLSSPRSARACTTLANGIIFYLFTSAARFDPVLAEKVAWSLQMFLTSSATDDIRKVTLIQSLLQRDQRWSDLLSRCGAIAVLQSVSTSLHHQHGAPKRHRAETAVAPQHRGSSVSSMAATAKALLSQIGSQVDPSTPVAPGATHVDDFSQCNEETLATLLMLDDNRCGARANEEADGTHSVASAVVDAVASGAVVFGTFRSAMIRALERALAPSHGSSAAPQKKLTKEQCDRMLQVNVCVPNAYAALQCPQHHTLRVHHSSKWTCNKCARHFPTGSLSCRSCDYDLCEQCASEMQPNRLDVSHCLVVSDVLRYVKSVSAGLDLQQPADDVMQQFGQRGDLVRHFVQQAMELRRVLTYRLNDSSRKLFEGIHTPSLSLDTAAAVPLHASLTIQQAHRRYANAGRRPPTQQQQQQLQQPGRSGGLMVHVHCVDSVSSLPIPCACTPQKPALLASPRLSPRVLPVRSSSPRQPSPLNSKASPMLQASALPFSLTPLETLLKACSDIKDWGASADGSASFSLNQLVVAQVRNHAADIFFLGVDGLPKDLHLVVSGSCKSLIDLAVRVEVMKFCGVDCRRAGLLHIFASNISIQRGHVPLALNEAPVPTKARVPRGDDVEGMMSAVDATFLAYPTIRSKVEFSFVGEEGTGDGPTQELYTEVSVCCSKITTMWWTRSDDGARILFPSTTVVPQTLVYFRALGACFARSFVDNFTMSVSLEPAFWKLVIAVVRDTARPLVDETPHTTQALEEISIELESILHKSLTSLKSLNDVELTALDMVFADDITSVTSDNIDAYVAEVLGAKFCGAVIHTNSFVCGFASVLDPHLLLLIHPSEADTVFCGGEQDISKLLTEDLLRLHIVGAHGYTSDSSELQWIIRAVAAMDKKDQSLFVEFLTGSPRLPVGGLAGLNRNITVAKKEFDCGQQTLPSCNTCFLYLKVPPYKTEAKLTERLLLAIREGRRNFSLS